MFTNQQKLAAVLTKWVQPAVQQLASQRLDSMPFLAGLTNKIRATGWVSPQWSIGTELAPMMQGLSGAVIEPFILSQIQQIPDESIPQMAHSIVDEALKHGQLSLFEGNVVFEKEDIEELKKLLDYNLPVKSGSYYKVRTEPGGEDADA